jgi:hypothetical protein
MARPREHREIDLRNRAKALGYDLFPGSFDGKYVLAKRVSEQRRVPIVGKEGGVTLDAIERWLDKHHPAAE